MLLSSEFPFTLPVGLVDPTGAVHRDGVMRRATVLDELDVQMDGRVQQQEIWLPVLLLSRVVLRIGALAPITPALIGGLYSSDFSYLQSLYLRINGEVRAGLVVGCPSCGAHLHVPGGG